MDALVRRHMRCADGLRATGTAPAEVLRRSRRYACARETPHGVDPLRMRCHAHTPVCTCSAIPRRTPCPVPLVVPATSKKQHERFVNIEWSTPTSSPPWAAGEGFGNGGTVHSGAVTRSPPSPMTLLPRTAVGLSQPSAGCRPAGFSGGGFRCITHRKGRAANWPSRTRPSVPGRRSFRQRRRSSRSAGTRRPRSPRSSEREGSLDFRFESKEDLALSVLSDVFAESAAAKHATAVRAPGRPTRARPVRGAGGRQRCPPAFVHTPPLTGRTGSCCPTPSATDR